AAELAPLVVEQPPGGDLKDHSDHEHEHGDQDHHGLLHRGRAAMDPGGLDHPEERDLCHELQPHRGSDQDDTAREVAKREVGLHPRQPVFPAPACATGNGQIFDIDQLTTTPTRQPKMTSPTLCRPSSMPLSWE